MMKVGYLLIEPLLPDLRYNHAPSNPYRVLNGFSILTIGAGDRDN